MKRFLHIFGDLIKAWLSSPKTCFFQLARLPSRIAAREFVTHYVDKSGLGVQAGRSNPSNPLREYFDNHTEGHGIWKWNHYFEIYHRHFSKFVGHDVNIAEIGIYSGGSLDMWKSYFGDHCHVYGIDIEKACTCYENAYTTVLIGDQEDRAFWKDARDKTPPIDILIDDGGHTLEQQKVTLEEMLPYLRPGGVYLCEDTHGTDNRFASYASGLIDELNRMGELSAFQKCIHSLHFYPYCIVIEKHEMEPEPFADPKHGTRWQPFFDK
jgi:hypothetical protein